MRAGLAGLVLVLALLGCTSGRETCVPLGAASGSWCLLNPGSAAPFSVLSQLELQVPGRRETLLVQVENDAQALRAALMTPLGQRLALVVLQAGSIESELPQGAALPDARILLVLVQLVRWPAELLRTEALAQGLSFRAEAGHRQLFDAAGRLLASAHCGQAPCQLEVPSWEMRLTLLDLPPAEPVR